MNPLKKDKYETTIAYCQKSIPGFDTVEDMVSRYVNEATEKVIHSLANSEGQISEDDIEGQRHVMTCQEFDNYLHQVFEKVFSLNNSIVQGIQSFRRDIVQQQPQNHIMWSTHLPEWMAESSKAALLKRDFVSLLTSLSGAHFYRHHHHWEGGLEETTTGDGKCPTCGLAPHFGAIHGEEGFRDLECWLCGTEWRFSRLACPTCHENRQEKLGYFSIEDIPHCRVSFCRSCESYIKVFDLRQWAEKNPNLWILHLATLVFDDLAVSEGFQPASRIHWDTTPSVETNSLKVDNH